MAEFLSNGAWQGIGVLLAVMVSFAIYFLQRQRKELAFGVLSEKNLLTVSEEVAKRVQITLDGNPISNIKLLHFGIKNSGDHPILAADFASPLKIRITGTGKIVSAEVVKQHPKDLGASISNSPDFVELGPLLINPGDHFVIKVLHNGAKVEASCSQRIAGLPETVPINKGTKIGRQELQYALKLSTVLAIFGAALYIARHFGHPAPELEKTLIGFTFGAIVNVVFRWSQGVLTNSQRRYIEGNW